MTHLTSTTSSGRLFTIGQWALGRAGVFIITVAAALAFIAVTGCTPKTGETAQAKALQSYIAAFNRHDAAAVAALLGPRIRWMTVDIDKLTVEGQGRDEVRSWLESYFRGQPDVHVELLSLEQTGILLAVRERVTWTVSGKSRAQQSHAVYEVREGLVTNVWYFPAVREDSPDGKQEPDIRKR